MSPANSLLLKFCSRTVGSLYELPFAAGPNLYATDNAIAIRLPAAADPGIRRGEMKTGIQIARLIEQARAPTAGLLVSLADLPRPIPCVSCSGTGRVSRCLHCLGGVTDGVVNADPCRHCHGTGQHKDVHGRVACRDCCGSGEEDEQAVKVGAAEYKRRYLALIASLPSVQISLPREANETLYFRCTLGDGVLAAIRTGDKSC